MLGRLLLPWLRAAVRPEIRQVASEHGETVRELRRNVAELQTQLAHLRSDHHAFVVNTWTEQRSRWLPGLDDRLQLESLRAHLTEAIQSAPLVLEPTAHLLIENPFPRDFYELAAAAIPPGELFPLQQGVKQEFVIDKHLAEAPELTRRVWHFIDQEVVPRVLAPALLARLHDAIVEHYAEAGGVEFGRRAAALPHRAYTGQLHRRRPGYRLEPHFDPKRVVITGLLYFAKPGDTEAYGTQLFRIDGAYDSRRLGKFYPEREGLKCEVARTIPYRSNTMLVFINSKAAHGAELPLDAKLRERWAYQFYVKPVDGDLVRLLADAPEDTRARWSELVDD